MAIPSHWPAEVRARASQFLSLHMYFLLRAEVRSAAAVHIALHNARWELTPLEHIASAGVLGHWFASLYVLVESGVSSPFRTLRLTSSQAPRASRHSADFGMRSVIVTTTSIATSIVASRLI